VHGTRRDRPRVGRPSACAESRLAAGLRDQIDGSKLAWEAALLRGDAAISSGDAHEVEAALAEQRAILVTLETRLGEVVASATAEREAEHVITAVPDRPRRRPLRHVPAVLGSAAAALVAFAVVTFTGAPGVPDVASVAEAITSAGDVWPAPAGEQRDAPPVTGPQEAAFAPPVSTVVPFEGSVPADASTAAPPAPTDGDGPADPPPDATTTGDHPRDDHADEGGGDPTWRAPRPTLVLPEVPAPPAGAGPPPPEEDVPATPSLDLGIEDLTARLADAPDDDPDDDGDGSLLP
jgi:hypothetical protein